MIYDTLIIGGGASGLYAMTTLINNGIKNIALLERLDRVGKKLVSTGNGQGNLFNEILSKDNYYSTYSKTDDFCEYAISNYGVDSYKEFLKNLGVVCSVDESGRGYPFSKQASSVLDLIRANLKDKNAEIRTNFFVNKIVVNDDGTFTVWSTLGDTLTAKTLLFATGGNAQKQFGTDGNGYKLLTDLSHTVTKLTPSLVQLKVKESIVKSLRGLKANAVVIATKNGEEVKRAKGEILFTDYGVSGNAIFQISGHIADGDDAKIIVEFLPEISENELKEIIAYRKKNNPYLIEDDLLSGLLHNTLGRNIIKNLPEKTAKAIANAVKNFTLTVTGSTGFNYAQVTKGGINVNEVDEKTMESKLVENLYIVGEVLDVDGDCGGYNLQWAYSSSQVACNDLLKKLGN